MNGRRNSLAKSGTALAVPLLGGIASADEDGNKDETVQTIFHLLRNEKEKRAKRLADAHGISLIQYDIEPIRSTDEESGQFGTEDWFTNPGDNGTTVDFFIGAEYDETAWFQLDWDLYYDGTNLVDGASPADVAIIAWEDSQWGLTDLDNVYYNSTAIANDGSKQSVPIDMAGGGLIGERQNAIGLKIHDVSIGHSSGIEKMRGYLQLKLRKQNYPYRSEGRVEALYEHTSSLFDNVSFNFLDDVSIAQGPLSVDVSTGSDSWEFREDHSA